MPPAFWVCFHLSPLHAFLEEISLAKLLKHWMSLECRVSIGSGKRYGAREVTEVSRRMEHSRSEYLTCILSVIFPLKSHDRYVVVSISALSRKPTTLDHSKAGSMTLPWLCAWITVDTLANVKEGDNVIIIGMSLDLCLVSFFSQQFSRCSWRYRLRSCPALQGAWGTYIWHIHLARQSDAPIVHHAH